MAEFFGENRHACVAREISKLFEDFQRGTLKELIDHFTENGVKGEIVMIVEGKPKKKRKNQNKNGDSTKSPSSYLFIYISDIRNISRLRQQG